jgi:hypothetical protein
LTYWLAGHSSSSRGLRFSSSAAARIVGGGSGSRSQRGRDLVVAPGLVAMVGEPSMGGFPASTGTWRFTPALRSAESGWVRRRCPDGALAVGILVAVSVLLQRRLLWGRGPAAIPVAGGPELVFPAGTLTNPLWYVAESPSRLRSSSVPTGHSSSCLWPPPAAGSRQHCRWPAARAASSSPSTITVPLTKEAFNEHADSARLLPRLFGGLTSFPMCRRDHRLPGMHQQPI